MTACRTRELGMFTALLPQRTIRKFRIVAERMAQIRGEKWWAWQGLNLRPLRCQGRDTSAFPLKSAVFGCSISRTARERMRNRMPVYRTFAAQPLEALDARAHYAAA